MPRSTDSTLVLVCESECVCNWRLHVCVCQLGISWHVLTQRYVADELPLPVSFMQSES